MAVIRVEKTNNYAVMSVYHLRDANLDLATSGILSHMLTSYAFSKSGSWDYTLEKLAEQNGVGIDAARTALKKLERAGYVRRERMRDDKGRLGKMKYYVYKIPADKRAEVFVGNDGIEFDYGGVDSEFCVERTVGFMVMDRYHLRDKNLTLAARSLLTHMLSNREDWKTSIKGLSAAYRTGVDAIRAYINNLEKAGYVRRVRVRDVKGRLAGVEYVVYETPQTDLIEKAVTDAKSANNHIGKKPMQDNPTMDAELSEIEVKTLENDVYDVKNDLKTVKMMGFGEESANNHIGKKPVQDKPTLGEPLLENPIQTSISNITNTFFNKDSDLILSHVYARETKSEALTSEKPKSRLANEMGNDMDGAKKKIKENIEYPFMVEQYGREAIDGLVAIMTETVCTKNDTVVVAGDTFPANYVKEKLLTLTSGHIQYVLNSLKESRTKVRNIKKYLLAALFNASSTIDGYYDALWRHHNRRY